MNIKSYIAAAAVAIASFAMAEGEASYLYWMAETGLSEVSYAKVGVYNGAERIGYLTVASNGTGGEPTQNFVPTFDSVFLDRVAVIGSTLLNESYNFQLELYGIDNQVKWLSSQIAQKDAAIGSSWTVGANPTVFTGFHVPEPTGGLLAMLGFGLLALRRKQK